MFILVVLFFFNQKTAYEVRISDWSSDVCSSDLACRWPRGATAARREWESRGQPRTVSVHRRRSVLPWRRICGVTSLRRSGAAPCGAGKAPARDHLAQFPAALKAASAWVWRHELNVTWLSSSRSEEHTSELQSLIRISYAVFCL